MYEMTCEASPLCHTSFVPTQRKDVRMSLQNHLSELERRHSALDREIAKERIHPAPDEVKVQELKRRKLLLKDEITKLRGDKTLH